jgi:hypothetical protein
LFVYYDWGGYAIWRLYPEYRVFVDGRADLYGDDLLRQFQDSAQLQAGWEQVLDRWGVQAVLMPPSGPLAQGLLLDARWHSAYRDSQAILFLATDLPLKASSYQESASLGHKKVKKCVPEPSESAKLHETGAVPTAQRGCETATSRAISKRHSVGLGLCQQAPGWLGVGCGKDCSVRDFDPNLEDLNDKRSWQTNVAQ